MDTGQKDFANFLLLSSLLSGPGNSRSASHFARSHVENQQYFERDCSFYVGAVSTKAVRKVKTLDGRFVVKGCPAFLSSANGNLIGKSCEFKPISQSGEEYKKMVNDGKNRNLGTIFKFCGTVATSSAVVLGRMEKRLALFLL